MSSLPKRVTSNDVAREAGVSHTTVSYVLNKNPRQSIPEETRLRVLEAAKKLGYEPYAPARTLRMGKSNIVLVVWPEAVVEGPITQFIEHLAAALAKINYNLIWEIGNSPENRHLSGSLAPAVVVGVIDEANTEAVENLQRFKAPVFILSTHGGTTIGTRAQVEYLLARGKRPLVFAATDKPLLQRISTARQDSIKRLCLENGLDEPKTVTIPLNRQAARQAIEELLEVQPFPFAVCAYNDDVAFAVLAALTDLKIEIPRQVSIIGQDNSMIAELCNPPLTTVVIEGSGQEVDLIGQIIAACQDGSTQNQIMNAGTLTAKVIERSTT